MSEIEEIDHMLRLMRRIVQSFSMGMPRLPANAAVDTKAAAYDLGEAINLLRRRIVSVQSAIRGGRADRIPEAVDRLWEAVYQLKNAVGFEIFLGDKKFRTLVVSNEVGLEHITDYYHAINYFESIYSDLSKHIVSTSPDMQLNFLDVSEGEPIDFIAAVKSIREVVPEQKIAPAQFDIHEGRLVVAHQKASNGPDSNIASSARRALVETGQAVIDKLKETNCDRRMLDVVVNLQEKLQSQQDIVELGVFNISCEVVAAKFENELPDVVGAMLLAHSRGISSYVAQFPEWRTFTENAASAELSSADVQRLHQSSGDLVEELEKAPEIADPEVPKTIKLLRALIADPASIPKRAGYALLITLENLWSRVYGYAAEFLDSTIKKTIAISATAVAVTLVSIAAANALDLVPVTSKLADSAWVQTATKIIRRQLEELAKGTTKTE